ncbi:carboxy terminal-processing peptidase [Winogradskyella sp. DF17]|uniref:Carboxy terminal-processing peptidase n=1 Tax=Winogradskyella pelagia TaxID=2819984 RepID=A0ABS3SZ43_9FLAO|nr:carboxy terminal-processing peptidase [Winogradskyella sp. DF17]MBO3115739.1 carboxy terminal-processing peptidase [Winogradskyella sp. DF17]
MRGKYKFLLFALLIAFASCSFTNKTFDNSDKDKVLIQLITYLLDQGHFSPQELDDDFSQNVFVEYINRLDPYKRYFYASDIKEFEAYKYDIDDQIKAYDLTFFNLTHERLLQRVEESKKLYASILDKSFNYDKDEVFSADYENLDYVQSKREMKERWRKQLKFSSIANYDDLIAQRDNEIDSTNMPESEFSPENETTKGSEKKSLKELEEQARMETKEILDELHGYIDDRNRNDWFSVYINALVEEYDPHTSYLPPADKERFDQSISGNFEGIGARLSKKRDAISVVELISGGPAWRANELEVGDEIIKVKQEDEDEAVNIVGLRLDDAIKFIKGPKGTVVTLTLKKVDGTIENISIIRDVVELEETFVKSSTVDRDGKTFGVINLPKFYIDFDDRSKRTAAADMKKELIRLKEQNVEGLVLDLRNNGGGSLQTVVEMVGLFIEKGPVVQVKTTGEPKEVMSDTDESIYWDGPLVVLVNELSASASEIFAAAMQDYKRAIILGSEQTYGKGTVQIIFDLNRWVRNNSNGDLGALRFTTQKYYRIDGGSVQLEGVKSDVVVPDRYSYINIGEKDTNNPLPWDKIDPASYEEWDNYFDYETTIAKSKARMANNEQLKLIDANAKWVKSIRDRETYSLNYDEYRKEMELNDEEIKRFEKLSEYQTDLTFASLPYEVQLMEQDSVLSEKRARWHQNLSRDVYIEEALNVLNDLKMSYSIKNKVATSVKN